MDRDTLPTPMTSPLFAGLDVSTQGCKLVVIDPAEAALVHQDRLSYDADLPHFGTRNGVVPGLGDGVSEADPRMWIEAVDRLLAGLEPTVARRVRCLSVSAQQHGLVALDARGELARGRAKLWNDTSTAAECAWLTEKVGGRAAMIEAVGNTQRPGYTAGKILHLVRHEPEAYARAATLLVVHDYVNWYLTGGVAAMEPGDASGTALWNPVRERWAQPVLDVIASDLGTKLPPVGRPDATIGPVSAALVRRYGLHPDCRVDAGSGDNMYGAVGTGSFEPGVVTVTLGTSGTVAAVRADPFVDPSGEIAAYRDSTGQFLPLLCVSNMANAYNAVRRQLGVGHAAFEELVETTPPGNDGRLLVPWFEGERTPDVPDATPTWFGFAPHDLQAGPLARAVIEGLLQGLAAGYARFPVQADEVRVTGGLAASPTWRQHLADVLGLEVVPVAGEGAALGAAIHAAWVWQREQGRKRSLAEVGTPFVDPALGERVRPRSDHAAVYELQRRLYRALVARLVDGNGEDPFALRSALLRAAPRPDRAGRTHDDRPRGA